MFESFDSEEFDLIKDIFIDLEEDESFQCDYYTCKYGHFYDRKGGNPNFAYQALKMLNMSIKFNGYGILMSFKSSSKDNILNVINQINSSEKRLNNIGLKISYGPTSNSILWIGYKNMFINSLDEDLADTIYNSQKTYSFLLLIEEKKVKFHST